MDALKRMTRRKRNRANRVRKRIQGNTERPRLSVHRTNVHIYAQMIDDIDGRTLCAASSVSLKLPYGGNIEAAKKVGAELGRLAKEMNVELAGFDRGMNRYHGRVKALADAVREAGVKF
ncbi:MAG: 50S ribosomal protein L18 [Planctomycetota bacterium]|nr:50S ribosomal protein L18 [Planctomycetota bacterium]